MSDLVQRLRETAARAAEQEPRDWPWREKRRTSLATVDQVTGDDPTPYDEDVELADPICGAPALGPGSLMRRCGHRTSRHSEEPSFVTGEVCDECVEEYNDGKRGFEDICQGVIYVF